MQYHCVMYSNTLPNDTVQPEIYARGKFLPISLPCLIGENYLFCVNNYIEDMATFTVLVKIYSTEYFCNIYKGLAKFLSSVNFSIQLCMSFYNIR